MGSKLNPQQIAAITLRDLRSIAQLLIGYGEILDKKNWLFCIAHALGSARPGVLPVPKGHQRKAVKWFGLDFDNLKRSAIECCIICSDEDIEDALEIVTRWRDKRSSNPRIKPDTYARLLNVTAVIRREAGATFIGAIDETNEDRKAIRKTKDRIRKEVNRRKQGRKAHSESLSQKRPWAEQGISRSTWYRRYRTAYSRTETNLSATSIT